MIESFAVAESLENRRHFERANLYVSTVVYGSQRGEKSGLLRWLKTAGFGKGEAKGARWLCKNARSFEHSVRKIH